LPPEDQKAANGRAASETSATTTGNFADETVIDEAPVVDQNVGSSTVEEEIIINTSPSNPVANAPVTVEKPVVEIAPAEVSTGVAPQI